MAENDRAVSRGIDQRSPTHFLATQYDADIEDYVADFSSWLGTDTIASVLRTSYGPSVTNTSNDTTTATQSLQGFGCVLIGITTTAGRVKNFTIEVGRVGGGAAPNFTYDTSGQVGGNVVAFYDRVSSAQGAHLTSSTLAIVTAGSASAGDGGGQLYKRASSQPAHSLYFQSADGTYWESATWGNINGYNGPLTDKHNGSFVWKLADRLFVGASATSVGDSVTVGTFLGDTAAYNSQWVERNATILGVSKFGGGGGVFASRLSDQYSYLGASTIWKAGQTINTGDLRGYHQKIYRATNSGTTGATPPTHTSGTVSDGTVSWAFVEVTWMTPIGMTAVVVCDGNPDGVNAWASYFEAERESGAGTCFGMEIDTKNKGVDVSSIPTAHLPAGSTIGIWLAGGGDSTVSAAANPSTAAIVIGKNQTTWNTGIVFEDDGLTDVGSGARRALALGASHVIDWYTSAGTIGARIQSTVTDATKAGQIIISDNAFSFLENGASAASIENNTGAAPNNWPRLLSQASGTAPRITAGTSSDTNQDMEIRGKGTGGGRLADGAGAIKVQTSTTGIGFFATSPAAKQTVTGSRGANAALASLLSALAAYGFITDSSS